MPFFRAITTEYGGKSPFKEGKGIYPGRFCRICRSYGKRSQQNRDWRQGSVNRYVCAAFRLFWSKSGLYCTGKRTLILREKFLYTGCGNGIIVKDLTFYITDDCD